MTPAIVPMGPLISGNRGRLRWQVLPDWQTLLVGPGGLRIDEWRSRGLLHVVKQGPHRTVYAVRLPGRAVYIKHIHGVRPADVVRHLVRASGARREWNKAVELKRRGIPTVCPVAWQERTSGGVVCESFLVTEAIEPACSLEEFFCRRLPGLPAARQAALRRRLARSLARFTAALHRAGVIHPDLHAGNILVGPEPVAAEGDRSDAGWPLYLVDVPGLWFSAPLGWTASRKSLVMLNAGWWERASRSERLRFWRAYRRARKEFDVPNERAVLAELERGTRRYAQKIARRRDRRPLGTNRDFTALGGPGRVAHAVVELDQAERSRLLCDPQALVWENFSRPVKLGHSGLAVRAELGCGGRKLPVLYKRYRPRSWLKAAAARFRRGRAVRSWCGGHALLLRAIPTARPLAVCQVHGGAARGYGYLATEWIEGAENLHLYAWRLAELPEAERRRCAARCAERLGAVIGRMHAWGISHGDLKAGNLLVVDRPDGVRAFVIDADDVRVWTRLPPGRQAADLARLATSIQAHPWISRPLVCRFMRAYRRQFPPCTLDWKELWRTASKRSRRRTRRKQKRGEPVL